MAENAESEIVNLYQPKKRFIIPIDNFHVPKKLFKLFKRNTYTFKINNNFENVIYKCQLANRKDNGTWIIQYNIRFLPKFTLRENGS